ncbi:hypothetical protein ACFX15_022575 [Malus domestica]
MVDSKPCASPSSASKLALYDGELLQEPTMYRSLVGALQYLTWTRFDITFSVNQVCQHLQNPRTTHFTTVKWILRYLKGTLDHGLLLTKGSTNITAFLDVDWADCPIHCRSTFGFYLFFGNNLISWNAKKQPIVAQSSTKSEYRSLAQIAAEVSWICYLLHDIRFYLHNPPLLLCDNLSALALAANPIFHARTKHIEINYHYICELVIKKLVVISYVTSNKLIYSLKACPKLVSSYLVPS